MLLKVSAQPVMWMLKHMCSSSHDAEKVGYERHLSQRFALYHSPTKKTFKLGEVSNGKPQS